jgi:type IV secretory pathway TrbF-like protein
MNLMHVIYKVRSQLNVIAEYERFRGNHCCATVVTVIEGMSHPAHQHEIYPIEPHGIFLRDMPWRKYS